MDGRETAPCCCADDPQSISGAVAAAGAGFAVALSTGSPAVSSVALVP
jgi:hypothetical protein